MSEVRENPLNAEATIEETNSPMITRNENKDSSIKPKNLDLSRYVETDIDIQVNNNKLEVE